MPTAFVVKNGSKIFGCTSSGMPGPSSLHLEDDGVALGVVPRSQNQRAAAVRVEHRLLGVDDEVEQHLLNLMRIGEDRRQAGGERLENHDVGRALLVGAKRQRLAHDLVQIDRRARRVPLARERLQVADDARGALGGVVDGVEIAARLLVERGVPASRSAQARIVASGLFSSCATPDIVWPSAASFSACESWW